MISTHTDMVIFDDNLPVCDYNEMSEIYDQLVYTITRIEDDE